MFGRQFGGGFQQQRQPRQNRRSRGKRGQRQQRSGYSFSYGGQQGSSFNFDM